MKPTALVVDDDREMLDVTASLLELNGLKVVGKDEGGESALKHLQTFRPTVVVMDVCVRGGGDLLATIRRDNLPTRSILVTGSYREDCLVQALELGVEGYLNKPHIDELLPAVRAVLAGQRFFSSWAMDFLANDYIRLKNAERAKGLLTLASLKFSNTGWMGRASSRSPRRLIDPQRQLRST